MRAIQWKAESLGWICVEDAIICTTPLFRRGRKIGCNQYVVILAIQCTIILCYNVFYKHNTAVEGSTIKASIHSLNSRFLSCCCCHVGTLAACCTCTAVSCKDHRRGDTVSSTFLRAI